MQASKSRPEIPHGGISYNKFRNLLIEPLETLSWNADVGRVFLLIYQMEITMAVSNISRELYAGYSILQASRLWRKGFFATCIVGLLSISANSFAADWIEINGEDFLNADSLHADNDIQTLSFEVANPPAGELTSYEIDLSGGMWSSIDANGNFDGGPLPADASTQSWFAICFTSPVAAGGCVGAVIGSTLLCNLRDRSAYRRAQASCGSAGIATYNAGYCGAGSTFACRVSNQVR